MRGSAGGSQTPFNGERGAAAVELALVLPILVMVLVGIVQFGAAYEAKAELASVTREAARSAAIGGDATTTARAAVDSLTPTLVQVSAPTTACTSGQLVTVTSTYPYEWRVPFFGEGTMTLHARSTWQCLR